MKKLMSLLLVLCMMVTLCTGCASAAEPAPAEAAPAAAPAEPAGGASGEPAGGASGEASGEASGSTTVDTTITAEDVVIIERPYAAPEDLGMDLEGLYTGEDFGESLGDITVKAGETWTVEDSCVVDKLEIEEGAVVESSVIDWETPVIVFFSESETVENGQVMGGVQFVSEYDEVVAIVHTNDTHGFLESEPYVKGLKTQLEQSGKYSLVLAVSAGDIYAGGYAAAHVYEGEYIPYIMMKVYDYQTWGNNDAGLTDKGIGTYLLSILGNANGLTTLLANQKASETIDIASYAAGYEPVVGVENFVDMYSDVLSLNEDGTIDYSALNLESYNVEVGDNVLDDAVIAETANGTKIGLFGESTQGGSITDAYFSGGFSTVSVAQACSDALADTNATVMIAHTGWFSPESTEGSSNDTNTAQIAKKTTGIDAIIDSHTHSIINKGEGYLFAETEDATIVNQASCFGEAMGILYLYLNDGEVVAKDCENIVPNEDGSYTGILSDAEVQAAVDRCFAHLDADGYTTVYATTDYFLNGERISSGDVGGGVRANETNLGDLVADGILWVAQKYWQGEGAPIEIALYPGFWVRSSVEAGEITLTNAMSVFANPLKIYYAEYTAAELVSLMNTSCAKIGSENNNMFQVAGLKCTYDPATFKVVTLTVGDELIYDNGEYLVGDDWTVGCAAEVGGGNMTIPEGTEIVSSNSEMAKLWCEFLASGEYTIYPNEVSPDGRVVPAA